MTQPNIVPVLRYGDAVKAIDWLVRAFGFERRSVHDGPDGRIAHAELTLGRGVIGLSSTTDPDPGNPWSTVTRGIYVPLPNPDEHHARARAAGAEIVVPLTDMDYGSREYAARDLEGNLWGFGTWPASTTGVSSIFPSIRYADGPGAIAWLERAFGLTPRLVVPGPDNTIAHAELWLGNGVLMLGSMPDPQDIWRGQRHAISVAIDDPDAHYSKARAAGAEIARPIEDTPFGARAYGAVDLEGYVWTFGNYQPQPTGSATATAVS